MFDNGYKFSLVDKKSHNNDDLLYTHYYTFRGKRRYILLAEEYVGSIFIVKFYPHSHRLSPHKYNVLLADYDAMHVIRTAIDVMLYIYKSSPFASFGFIAANSIFDDYKETVYNNKRYRIYRQLMADFFPSDLFAHVANEMNGAYLLVNRTNQDIDTFTGNALKMFIYHYPDLDT